MIIRATPPTPATLLKSRTLPVPEQFSQFFRDRPKYTGICFSPLQTGHVFRNLLRATTIPNLPNLMTAEALPAYEGYEHKLSTAITIRQITRFFTTSSPYPSSSMADQSFLKSI